MAKKTWKLGEVCRGGVITVEATDKKITIIGKEWDFTTGSRKSSDQSNAKEFTRQEFVTKETGEYPLDMFLSDLSTSYWAGEIINWIKSKVKLKSIGW
jgi:hypothetical protein